MSTHLLRSIPTAKPVAPYLGGKRLLAKQICEHIQTTPHNLYAEPFVGMGGVFFRRSMVPAVEVINDANGEVANLFRILQRHYPQFMEVLRFQLTSRREFDRLSRTDPQTLTDLERAARFLYLQRTAFGGKVVGQNFAMRKVGRGARFDLTQVAPMLEDAHERLSGVTIEALDFELFIQTYDRPGALFYLDPPYWDCENDYDAMFDKAAFRRLAAVLDDLQGRFILSLNDTPGVRGMFAFGSFETVDLSYSITAGGRTDAKEVIITGGGDIPSDLQSAFDRGSPLELDF